MVRRVDSFRPCEATGLEVELEKQHVEGFHNRIAYFGRVLSGVGSGDKIIDGPAANDPVPPTRLVGVYEHGDFVLHRRASPDTYRHFFVVEGKVFTFFLV